jgi:hypothetical protein
MFGTKAMQTANALPDVSARRSMPAVSYGAGRWTPAILYMLLAVLLWKPFQYIMYKDEISYIAIAERYARADWATAPNAYWAPLVSWLLAVPLSLGIPTAISVKVLCVLTGLFAYFAMTRLLTAFGVNGAFRLWFSLVAIPSLVYYSLVFFTPDLLLAAILTLYMSVIVQLHALHNLRTALICGLLGALAYFCKGYALYFFIAHFILAALISSGAQKRLRVVRNSLCALVLTGALMGGWMTLLYMKYGIVSPGVVSAYNYAIVGPDSPGRPTLHVGFVAPPATATASVWEEPIYLIDMVKRWSPFESLRAFAHQIGLVKDNVGITAGILNSFSPLWGGIVLLSVLFWCGSAGQTRNALALTLIAMIVYPAGYYLVYSEQRYLWPMQMLLLCLTAFVMQQVWHNAWLQAHGRRWIAAGLVTISFLVLPAIEIARRADDGKPIQAVSDWFIQQGFRGARIASGNDYGASTILAYHSGAKYFGVPGRRETSAPDLERALGRHQIQYYLVWDGVKVDSAVLTKYKEVNRLGRRLTIYRVEPAAF